MAQVVALLLRGLDCLWLGMRMEVVESGRAWTLFFVVLMAIGISFVFVALLVSVVVVSVRKSGVVIPSWPISTFPLVVILVIIPIRSAVVPIFPPFPTSASPVAPRVVPITCLTITPFTPTPREVPRLSWLDNGQGLFGGPPVLSFRGLLRGAAIERSWFQEGGVTRLAEVDDGVFAVDLAEGGLEGLQWWELKRNGWLRGL